jgi:hypothetical protein
MVFKINLEQSRNNSYRIVSFFILLMHALLFGYFYLQSPGNKWPLLLGCIVNFLSLALFFLPPSIKQRTKRIFSIALIINASIWFGLGNILMGLLLIVLVVMNYYTEKKPVVIFSDDYILYPSFPSRKIYWKDVQGVIIKDDILTIDLKNNALIQQKIESHQATSLNLMAFNAFIETKLVASQS